MPSSAHASGTLNAGKRQPLHALLDETAASRPSDLAYRFVTYAENAEQLLTYGQLALRSRALAAWLVERGATGQPVLLILPPGHDFIVGLFACWYAGAIAVPASPPHGSRHRQRLQAILTDTGATLAIANRGTSALDGVVIVFPDDADMTHVLDRDSSIASQAPCLLQYTSGSTATPKGVMMNHDNFRSHFASLGVFADLELKSALSWLPPYHDMGLVLKILYAFEAGIPLTQFSPDQFVQKPARWLQAISRFRAELSGGPNFAFDACCRTISDDDLEGVDLSCWKAVPCGAERIRKETLDRFSKRFAPYGFDPKAFLPGYGMAETTLIVTACPIGGPGISLHPKYGPLVSNGPPLPGVSLRIADPESGTTLESGINGEIHISGMVVSTGYWKRSFETNKYFKSNGEFRTGDLGYIENGELFVTGRIKDLIILDGQNHHPEDLESVALNAASEVIASAAFPADTTDSERVILALETGPLPDETSARICAKVRAAIGEKLEIQVGRIVLVRRGLLPRTTSGKIQRSACRAALENGSLRISYEDTANVSGSITTEGLLTAILEITGKTLNPSDDPITSGIGSLDATRLTAVLRSRTGVEVSVSELFGAKSFDALGLTLNTRGPSRSSRPELILGAGEISQQLTHSQERMWFLHQFDPTSAAYHVFGVLELNGALAKDRLQSSYREIVSRHGILRSRHGFDGERQKVWIDLTEHPPLEIGEASNEEELRSTFASFASKPFHLATDSPIRAALISLDENRHFFAVCAHHIVADGWSLRILAKELAEHYSGSATLSTRSLTLYQDYAAGHRKWIDSGAVESQIQYWKNRLSGHSGILQLPTDFPRPRKPSSQGGYVVRILSPELCSSISDLARAHRATPFMVQLAALLVLLAQHGAGSDCVVAIPIANRNHVEAADLVGTLVNTLPFRMHLQEDDTFFTLLERVRIASFEMQENQDAPFEKIIEAVRPDRSTDHSPLAQVMFDHQEIPIVEEWRGGVTCKPYIVHRGAAQFELGLLLTIYGEQQQLAIEYRTDLFSKQTAEAMLDRHLATLDRACKRPQAPLVDAVQMPENDHRWLAAHTQGPDRPHFLNKTAPALIANRCAMHPDRIALHAVASSYTYQQMATRSDQLATALIAHGIRPGDRTAVLLERDLDLPITLLAIWKTGAAYVPLDRTNPKERLKLILNDQSPLLILVSPELTDHLPPEMDYLVMEDHLFQGATKTEFPPVLPQSAAYIIYTSGSTGVPKGVVVSHGALANFLLSMAETPGFTEADRLLAVTTVSFDISLLELFLPLVTGGSLEITTTALARDGHALLDRLHASGTTVMQATPATWRLLLDAGWNGSPDIKILCGGEALDLELASVLVKNGCQLWNLYGPTETTIWSTCWRVPANPEHIRIGKPIANTGIHILGENNRHTPPGVQGSLWISGKGLADGYWNRPELTDSQFTRIPSLLGSPIAAYNTGDIARWHNDGTLECLGRSDGQIKIRGFRVELGEIETTLAAHPQISQAKVALRGSASKLVAWFTTAKDETPPTQQSIQSFLESHLPPYMIPSDFEGIASFPLNSSGKVDVSQLRDPESVQRETGPLTTTEDHLIRIWKELLERPSIHPDENWFQLGGHSLLALRLFGRIHQQFSKRLPLSAILDQPTLRGLAQLIDQATSDPK